MKITDRCKKCGTCVAECPVGAITMKDKKAEINQDICVHCGYCQTVCPFNAIDED